LTKAKGIPQFSPCSQLTNRWVRCDMGEWGRQSIRDAYVLSW